MSNKYPEHEKLNKIADKSQVIGEFLEYLQDEKRYLLCELVCETKYYPVHVSIQDLLADFFGIDQKKLEKEKREMLEEIRAANSKT